MDTLKIQMLGQFRLEAGEISVSDSANRSRKAWCLLGYLICNRTRSIPQSALVELLWGEDDKSSNPVNALRITLHRLRHTLDELWPNAGKDLVIYKDGGYFWNPEIPMELDCVRFEGLLSASYPDEASRLAALLEGLSLYRGEFLPKLGNELWAIPIGTHYHNLFLQASLEAARILHSQGSSEQAAQLCQKASAAEPYHEELHQLWMQVLGAAGDTKAAAKVYDGLSRRLFDDFGIRPSEQTRQVYRETALSPEDRTLPMDEVLEHLQEPTSAAGAMICGYDEFKVLCFAERRSMERNGNASHVALFSVVSASQEELSKKKLERIMGQLEGQMQVNLRRGDAISRCSLSQLIILLPQANYENSCMVCRRLLAAFHRIYPQSGIKVNFMVQPLTPQLCVP